ncbi:hypothetical protein QVM07_16950, partial [Klebsiella pneumoniae]|uniref:hypothetical protein n=1 Tax=Klebsiella pneumoniae TaxID=573 RepID=UPI003523A6B1
QTETEATGAPQKHHYTLNQQVGSITGIVCFLPDIAVILAFPDDSLFVTKILIRNRAKPLAMRRLIG